MIFTFLRKKYNDWSKKVQIQSSSFGKRIFELTEN